MKNVINFYYNLYPKTIKKIDNYYYFEQDDQKFYFIIYERTRDELKYLYELNIDMLNNNILVHKIILNKDKEVITLVNDIPYLLIEVYVDEKKYLNLNELSYFNNLSYPIRFSKQLMRNNWPELWARKIDYFEYQINQMGKKYPLIVESFSYYVGLAENAISYIKNTLLEMKNEIPIYTVAHRRIKNNYTNYDFYNPLNLVIDYRTRDIAEYIKLSFFKHTNILEELDEYFYHNPLSLFEARCLFARVLFPTAYFDTYEEIMAGKKEEKEIVKLASITSEYEDFLLDIYHYLKRMYNIPEIEWLTKNKEIIPRL